MWLSCEGSKSAIEAAKVQAIILSGRYRDNYIMSKFNRENSGCCSMCYYYPGNVQHYLSGLCPALSSQLHTCLQHSLNILSNTPYLLESLYSAISKSAEDWIYLIADPATNSDVIKIRQHYGSKSIWPLFRLSRAYIWCMHCERTKLINS